MAIICSKELTLTVISGLWEVTYEYYECSPPITHSIDISTDKQTVEMTARVGPGKDYSDPELGDGCSSPCLIQSDHNFNMDAGYTFTASNDCTLRLATTYTLRSNAYTRYGWGSCLPYSVAVGTVRVFVNRWVNGVDLDGFTQVVSSGPNSTNSGVLTLDTPLLDGDAFYAVMLFGGLTGGSLQSTTRCVASVL